MFDLELIRAKAQAVVDASLLSEREPSGRNNLALSAANDTYDSTVTPDVVLYLLDEIESLQELLKDQRRLDSLGPI